MSKQIFKEIVPKSFLYDLLEMNCIKTEKYYILNNDSYKKGVYNESIMNFIKMCEPYYHLSKKKYLERKLTYNSFTTIIRQICNSNFVVYSSQIKYNKSKYDIYYYIYF